MILSATEKRHAQKQQGEGEQRWGCAEHGEEVMLLKKYVNNTGNHTDGHDDKKYFHARINRVVR